MSEAEDLDRLLAQLWKEQVEQARARRQLNAVVDEPEWDRPPPAPGVGPERVAELQALPSLLEHCTAVLEGEWRDAEARKRELELDHPPLAAFKVHHKNRDNRYDCSRSGSSLSGRLAAVTSKRKDPGGP